MQGGAGAGQQVTVVLEPILDDQVRTVRCGTASNAATAKTLAGAAAIDCAVVNELAILEDAEAGPGGPKVQVERLEVAGDDLADLGRALRREHGKPGAGARSHRVVHAALPALDTGAIWATDNPFVSPTVTQEEKLPASKPSFTTRFGADKAGNPLASRAVPVRVAE